MLMHNMQIIYEKNKNLLACIDFFNKPYSQPENLEYLYDARFNNFRPFQMLI